MDSVKSDIRIRKEVNMQYTQLSRRSAGGKIDWEKQYLTFIPVENAVFYWAERATSGHLEYSLNGGQTWVTIANGESTPTITAGSKIMWRGNLEPSSSYGIGIFSASGNYNAYGNIMSLLYYDNYYNSQLNSTKHQYVFYNLFKSDTHLLSAPLLPSTTLAYACYSNMFDSCKSLVTAPELPATTLAISCYSWMFRLCTSLTIASKLPATTLAVGCYYGMFYGCTSLTVAPELPATTLINTCYIYMFCKCTKLNYIKALFTTNPSNLYTEDWVSGVAATGTFVKSTEATWTTIGVNGVPEGWTVVDNA